MTLSWKPRDAWPPWNIALGNPTLWPRVPIKTYTNVLAGANQSKKDIEFNRISKGVYLMNVMQCILMTSSNGDIFPVTGHVCGEFTSEFIAQKPVMRSFGVFFDLRLNERLSKHSWGWWFETPSPPLWRHINEEWWNQSSILVYLPACIIL